MKMATISILVLFTPMQSALAAGPAYLGATNSIVVSGPGCNTSSPVQIPGTTDLFINRQLLTADGAIAGIDGANDCSGAKRANIKAGKIYGRQSLLLNRFDWARRKFSIVKPLIDTSITRGKGTSSAIITGGDMRGAVIRSAYDADIVRFRGKYLVAYECTIENGRQFGIEGTSSCLSVYDPERQAIDFGRTKVIVSGRHGDNGGSVAAAVPQLLVYGDKLYIYWSALQFGGGKGKKITARGAEIVVQDGDFRIAGSSGRLVRADDSDLTTAVWSPDPRDPLSNTTVNLTSIWAAQRGIVAAAAVGGDGCVNPQGRSPGCFRLMLATANTPLGRNIFNQSEAVSDRMLPTNPQEYARPVRDDSGRYWLYGHFIRPQDNGFSELRPAPAGEYWGRNKSDSVMVMLPLAAAIQPVEPPR